jgi:Haemolymph juvenile hormone binding protein (JHBP).
VGVRIDKLEILGNYTMSSWFSRSQGRFNVTLSNVYIEGLAKLEVERGGQLQAQNIDMDIVFENIAMNFENLGFMGSLFQVSSPLNVVFDIYC